MAVTTDYTTLTPELTAERAQEFNESFLAESRKAGLAAVEAYEKAGWGFGQLQARVAKASQVDWLTSVFDAQADFTRTVVSAQTSAARSMLS